MTEKRFYLDVSEAYSGILKIIDFGDGTENIYPTSSRPDMEIVVELLNELNNENEELKQFKEKVFSLFSKEITQNEEAIEWGEETGADSSSMGFYNHMLKRLKKELEE